MAGKKKDNHQKKILKNPENIYGPIFVGEKKKLEYMCSVSDSVKKKKLETFQQSEKVKWREPVTGTNANTLFH